MALFFVSCVGLAYCNRKCSLSERGLQCAKCAWIQKLCDKKQQKRRKGNKLQKCAGNGFCSLWGLCGGFLFFLSFLILLDFKPFKIFLFNPLKPLFFKPFQLNG